jgi:PAS domain S-box-containing protein
MFLVLDTNGKATLINKKGCEVLGYKEKEIIDKSWFDTFLPERNREKVKKVFYKLIAGEIEPVEYFENPVLTKDGEERLIAWHNTILRDSHGNITGTLSSGLDITERRKAEETMKKSSIIIDSTTDAVITTDIAGNITFWNRGAERIYGYQKKEIIGKPISILYKDEDLHVLEAMIADLMEGKDIPGIEATCIDKNQQDVEILLSLTSIKDEDGNITELVGITKDITDRKEAEEALRKSEERFKILFESAPDAYYIHDLEGRYIDGNKAAVELGGYSKEEGIGKSFFELGFVAEEDIPKVNAALADVRNGKPYGPLELTMYRKDRSKVFLETHQYPVEIDGQTVVLGIARDITERKQAENKLRQSEERFKILFESAPDAYYIHDLEGYFVDGNKVAEQMIGYKKEEALGKNYFELGMVAEEDIPKVISTMADNKDGKPAGPVELTLYRKDGSEVVVETRSYPVEIGGQILVLGIARDITERKRSEKELKESEERFRKLSEAAFEGIGFSENGVLVDANDALAKIYDSSLEELKGKRVIEMVAPEHRKLVTENIRSGHEGPYEHKGIRKDGSLIDLEIQGRNVIYKGRKMRLTAIRDITERKKAENKLKDYQRQLKSLASELVLAEERERRRIAAGLHDDIAQKLAMAKFSLQSLQASAADSDLSQSLERQSQVMEQIVEDARSLTFELSNPLLYQVGLEAAVESHLAKQIQGEFGIKCSFKSEGPRSSLEDDIKVVLFQAVRELLANVIKHANANSLEVCITNSGYELEVVVEDDGVGFNPNRIGPQRAEGSGFGLFNIRERLEYLGGSLTIESEQKKGARVTMSIPIKADAKA